MKMNFSFLFLCMLIACAVLAFLNQVNAETSPKSSDPNKLALQNGDFFGKLTDAGQDAIQKITQAGKKVGTALSSAKDTVSKKLNGILNKAKNAFTSPGLKK